MTAESEPAADTQQPEPELELLETEPELLIDEPEPDLEAELIPEAEPELIPEPKAGEASPAEQAVDLDALRATQVP
jgi:hypothetical protein